MGRQLQSQQQALVASTAATFTFSDLTRIGSLVVLNLDGADSVDFVFDTRGTVPSDPTVGGADQYRVAAAAGTGRRVGVADLDHSGDLTVKAISAGTPRVSVEIYDQGA